MHAVRSLIQKTLATLSIALFAALVVVTTWQVFTRQVLDAPSTWSEELSKLLFVFLSFIGAAYMFGERGHIAVDYLVRKLPITGQRAVAIVVQLVVLFFALVGMVWGGILAAGTAWGQNLTALPLTIGWVYLIIPITGVAIAVLSLIDLAEIIRGDLNPYAHQDGDL